MKSTGYACLVSKHGFITRCNNFMTYYCLWNFQVGNHWPRWSHSNFSVWCGFCFFLGRDPQIPLCSAMLYYLPHFYAFICSTEHGQKNSFVVFICLEYYLAHGKCSKVFVEWLWYLLWGIALSCIPDSTELIHWESAQLSHLQVSLIP